MRSFQKNTTFLRSFQKNTTFSCSFVFFIKRTLRSLHSFMFFIKECCVGRMNVLLWVLPSLSVNASMDACLNVILIYLTRCCNREMGVRK